MTPTQTLDDSTALVGAPKWTALEVPPVTTPRQEQDTTDYMNLAKAFQTRVKEFFKPHKDRAYAAWKGLCASENEAIAAAVDTEAACKAVLSEYRARLERVRVAEETRLRELARQQEEQRRVDEAARLEAEASANPDLTEAHYQRKEAEALIEAPLSAPPVVVMEQERPKGASYKDKFITTAADKMKFLRFLSQHLDDRPDLIALIEFNSTNLRKIGDTLKKEGEAYPGIWVKKETNVSGRTR